MDKELRKKAVAAGTMFFLGMAAGYLLRNEISDIMRSGKRENKAIKNKEEPTKKMENVEVHEVKIEETGMGDLWTGMTWEKIRNILGSRYPGADVVRVYYALTPEERMEWRKGLRRDALTPLDKAFVYLDSRMLVQQDPTRKDLLKAVSLYSQDVNNFPHLFEEYSQIVEKEYGVQL